MTPNLRKFSIATHVTFSVGLLGSIAAFLALAVAGLLSKNTEVIRAAYLGMNLLALFLIVPLAFTSLLTGLVLSLGTSWGLVRHYWVLAKLLLTAFATSILLAKLKLISYAAHLASEDLLPRSELFTTGRELAFHAASGLLILLLPTILSIYKPRGLTPYGQRKQQEPQEPSHGTQLHWQQLRAVPKSTISHSPSGLFIIALRRTHVMGAAIGVLVLHIIILHFAGVDIGSH